VAGEGFAQRRPGGAEFGRGGVDAAQLFGEVEGALGLGTIGQEAAGLPAHPPLGHGPLPVGEGGFQDLPVDAELAGGLPQPDLVGELVGLLGQLPTLPQDTGRGEGVVAQPAPLAGQGAAEHTVILIESASGLDREVPAVVADLT
jgi:hypothetical protein